MNYKKILKNRNFRIKLLGLFDWIPDKIMLKIQYHIKMGRKLNLDNPKRFTEKLQWYKLYYKNPIMSKCVDKFEVRKFVEDKGFSNILNKCYGIYENIDDINFENLPNKFVLKDTLGGGGNAIIIVNNKNEVNIDEIKNKLLNWLNTPIRRKNPGREWPYDKKRHRIIIEKYIESDQKNGGLIDYKFFCNSGKPKYLYVITDRNLGGISNFGIYDTSFDKLNVKRVGEKENIDRKIIKPENFDEMLRIAEKLSEDFPHARIDLYNEKGKIIFGEITFYNASGYMLYDPDDFDYKLGEGFELKEYKNE